MNVITQLYEKLNKTNFKYKASTILCVFVHSSIAVFSLLYDIMPLFLFNTLSILIYVFNIFIVEKHADFIFYITFAEIILHSFISVILLGNDFGFSMYFILLVPMAYNMLHSINTSHYIIKSNILSVVSFLLYVTCYVISNNNDPIYQNAALDRIRPYVYIVNMFITFFTLSVFSIMFIIETVEAYNKLRSQNQQLDTLANTDPLTGLYNRRTMTDHVMNIFEDYKVNSEPFSIIICDIDDFKVVNDTYGHKCGDEVLKTVATTFSGLTREKDFVCRWGGEEFLILLNNTDIEQAKTIAERVRSKICNTEVSYAEHIIKITMTFGVATVTEEADCDALFRLADSRLYQGKKNGKNVVV